MPATILFVDDDPKILSAVVRALRLEPYEVLTALDASAAFELLARGDVQVVVSDQRMRGVPGTDFLAQVRERYPRVVRIMMTAFPTMGTALASINEAEVFRFLLKPVEPLLLQTALEEALVAFRKGEVEQAGRCQPHERHRQLLEASYPGISRVDRDETGAHRIDELSELEISEITGQLFKNPKG